MNGCVPMILLKDINTHFYRQRLGPHFHELVADAPIPDLDEPDAHEGRVFNKTILDKIRDCCRDIITPTWLTMLPQTFGSASGGSLKADEWRVAITLYVPLVIIREWPTADAPDSAVWLRMTTDLMSAISACSSHTVCRSSIRRYNSYMIDYFLQTKSHFPDMKWVSNCHAALHIGDLLEEYGPAHGWWTFPFERIIKELQNVPNNARIGEPNYLQPLITHSFDVRGG